jgi:lysophospholipase L1-like esterase
MRIPNLLINPKKLTLYVALVLPAMVMSGCGGGGAASSLPTTPTTLVRVACVGDSITGGTGNDNAYPTTLSQLLGRNYDVENFGVGSATLLNMGNKPYQQQPAFKNAVGFKPNIVIVALGTNDREYTFDPQTRERFKADYKTLIAEFRKSNPSVKVYTCLSTPSLPLQGTLNTTLTTDILPLIRQVAQENNARVIDLNTPLIARTDLFLDGVHPNTEGAKLIASTIYGAIASGTVPQTP